MSNSSRIGGTAGAVVTCPFEVVKTRLQSSVATFEKLGGSSGGKTAPQNPLNSSPRMSPGLWGCLLFIVRNEGYQGLFKGLGPNLVGVFPSRAIYFCAYAQAKSTLNQLDTVFEPDTPQVHMSSAAFAGFSASTLTNPIWYIKTRLQLDQKRTAKLTVWRCVKDTYTDRGIRGFYRGITASYYGIAETATHFVIYEYIKSVLRERKRLKGQDEDEQYTIDFVEYMGAGAVSKTTATILAYPHEVARTRLRQEGNVYRSFWQTLLLVHEHEGVRGLYRGLATQLVRQIPNTAIMMSVYEAVVYLCSKYVLDEGETTHDY